MVRRHSEAIVIGGGVVGAACAYYLARAGVRVRIVEANAFGSGCSHGNCGLVCPSHVLPLASPGAIAKVARAMIRGNAPLAIRPGLNFPLWSWLWKFARRCRADLMLQAAHAQHALLQSSKRLFDELRTFDGFDCEWQDEGLLFVYNSRREFEAYAKTEELIREHFGVSATRIEGEDLSRFEPALKDNLGGAWHYGGDSHLRPDKLMTSWRRLLAASDVEIIEHASVKSIDADHRTVCSLNTSRGEMTADAYVLASGALAPQLARQLRCRLPIQPGKGYSITMPRPEGAPKIPMILEEYHVGVTPMQTGFRLGSTMEFAGYDTSIHPRRIALLKKGAEECLRTPYVEPVLETWYGWRPMTYDGLPFIGVLPGADNAFVAAGHGMLGVSTSPATGKLIAELVAGETPHVDPRPYSVKRL
jgi:D-amino-acid dehydrogenase